MTNKEAATILRDLCRLALPTVNGIPFPEIKTAIILGAEALDPTPERNCDECAHHIAKRTEDGTVYGCNVWECDFKKAKTEEDEAVEEARREAMRLDDNEDTYKYRGHA